MYNRIAKNYQVIQDNILRSCDKVKRNPADIKLVAVTKSVGFEEISCLYDLGIRDFAENRVAIALEKAKLFSSKPDITWHFTGHLQRNKAKLLLGSFSYIHSVESKQLLEVLHKNTYSSDITLNLFLEVNISGEASKYGVSPSLAKEFLIYSQNFPQLKIIGLMTMAPFSDNKEDSRVFFHNLRILRDSLATDLSISLPNLSMGMTGDYEIAIEEGATFLRIGTAFFY